MLTRRQGGGLSRVTGKRVKLGSAEISPTTVQVKKLKEAQEVTNLVDVDRSRDEGLL